MRASTYRTAASCSSVRYRPSACAGRTAAKLLCDWSRASPAPWSATAPIHLAVDNTDLLLDQLSGAAFSRRSPAEVVNLRGEVILLLHVT